MTPSEVQDQDGPATRQTNKHMTPHATGGDGARLRPRFMHSTDVSSARSAYLVSEESRECRSRVGPKRLNFGSGR